MNVLSLFSGIGGLELGLERAGMTVVGQVEINEYCRRVLAKHWPEVPRHDDVTTAVDWWRSQPRPTVHVVCGGFPCQPFSTAGLRRKQADERWLWPATWAVIRDLRPHVAILENVPGLLAGGMGDVLGDLAAGGYDAEWDCVPAAAVGAPHRRDRVFIIAADADDEGLSRSPKLPGRRNAVPRERRIRADVNGRGPRVLAHAGSQQSGERHEPDGIGRRSIEAEQARLGRRAVADTERPRPQGITGTGQHLPLFAEVGQSIGRQWATEPDVGRVAHGIPQRVDRLRALGNAVVPQVAEHIGRLVMAGAP